MKIRNTIYANANRKLLTKRATADRLGISTRTLDRIAASGGIEKIYVRGSVKFRIEDVQQIEQNGV